MNSSDNEEEDESATESRSKETLTMGSPPSTSLETKDKVDNKQLYLDAFSRHALLAVYFKRYVADFKCRLAETRAKNIDTYAKKIRGTMFMRAFLRSWIKGFRAKKLR